MEQSVNAWATEVDLINLLLIIQILYPFLSSYHYHHSKLFALALLLLSKSLALVDPSPHHGFLLQAKDWIPP